MKISIAAILVGLAITRIATAQNVHVVEMSGQPLIYMQEGNPSGCGIRVVGIDGLPTSATARVFDASANVYRAKGGVVKVSSYDSSVADMQVRKAPRLYHVKTGWLRGAGTKATTPLAAAFKGDDGHAILYPTSADSIIGVLKAVMLDAIVHVGIRRDGEPTERIYSGKIKLSDAEREQLSSCISDLIR